MCRAGGYGLWPSDLNPADVASGPSWGQYGGEGTEPVECCARSGYLDIPASTVTDGRSPEEVYLP